MRGLKNIFGKRSVAWCVLAVVVLLSLSLSGGGALREYRGETLDVFYMGVNGDGLSIANDLKAQVKAARDYAAAARRAGADDERAASVEDAARALDEADSIAAKYRAHERLRGEIESLVAEVKDAFPGEVSNGIMGYVDEFRSNVDKIGRDAYNDKAARFNDSLKSFPASFIAMIGGVHPVELFA